MAHRNRFVGIDVGNERLEVFTPGTAARFGVPNDVELGPRIPDFGIIAPIARQVHMFERVTGLE